MSANRPHRNARPPGGPAPVNFNGRDSFWAERHGVRTTEGGRTAHKKWQCLACGQCGFVEAAYGEESGTAASRRASRSTRRARTGR
jgi:hypothetical protein